MIRVEIPGETISRLISEVLTSGGEATPDALAGAAQHQVLPLFEDFMGCWALTADGVLVFFAWDDPSELFPVASNTIDAGGAHVALARGSRRYPDLAGMAPKRPPDGVTCIQCDGSGRLANVPANVVCICGGLGWHPPITGSAA